MTETKYYVDGDGVYLGGFSGAMPPEGSIEVHVAPDDARQIWLGNEWSHVPTYIPQEVTRFQALAALHLAGLLEQVDAIMAAQETSVLTKLAWQNAQTFKRHSTMVLAIAEVLQLSEQQLDDLFITAAGVE